MVKIALAQTKPVTGDLEGNVAQILEDIKRAKEAKADIVVFPETAITGYCCGALFEQENFIAYNKQFLEEIIAAAVPEDMVAVVGFVDYKGRKKNGNMNITNSAAVLQGGKVVGVYDKNLLANGDHHEDRKYFTPGKTAEPIEVTIGKESYKLGIAICEDVWKNDHERDIVQELTDKGADIIVSPNQSYFYYGKMQKRYALFGEHAQEKQVPIIAVNASGVGDIVKNIMIYDGSSFAFDGTGNLALQLKRFEEDFQVVDMPLKGKAQTTAVAHKQTKFEEIYDALVFEQKELFRVIGIPNAQVHISGGIDSAIVAAIVAESMGKEHSVFITNPTEDNGLVTRGNAQYIADTLGIPLYWNSTQEPYKSVVESHTKAFGGEPTLTGKACIQAVLRTVQGIGAYHTFKSGIVACGNHTEIVEGWATFHDIGSIGVHSIIGDLTKLELYDFSKYINQKLMPKYGREVIPHTLYDGTTKPAAELADAKDDPIDYFIRSGIDAEMIRERKSMFDLMHEYKTRTLNPDYFPPDHAGKTIYEHASEELFQENVVAAFKNAQKSVFKSAQAAPVVIISPRSRGFSNRETIINKFAGYYEVK